MSKSNKLPAIQFYPGDWKKDVGVQSLSYHERGIWMELLFLMHESTERGRLLLNGKAPTIESLSRILGIDIKILTKSLQIIIDAGVPSVDPETGVIYSRRMVRDEKLRQIRKQSGKLGGNPNLVNQKSTKNQPNEQNEGDQSSTPSSSSSSSISSSDNILGPKEFLKDEILNQGYWMVVRSSVAGLYQGENHLLKLLDDFCEEKQLEPFNDTKHRFNAFRYWVRELNKNPKKSQNQTETVTTIAVSKPMAE